MQKHVNLVDLVKSFPTNIYLQNLASIQKRTSPVKFAHLAEKSGKGSISNLSTKACGGKLFSAPLLVLVLHLCVGDTWNCVNNIEKRLGTSAVGVLAVLASVYAAVAVYWSTVPLAGMLLAPSALWISIASVLTWTIWKINEPREPLLPKKGEGKNAQFRLPLSAVFEK